MYKIYGIIYLPEQRIVYVGQTQEDVQYRFIIHLYHSYLKGRAYNRKISQFIRNCKVHDLDILILEDNIETLEKAYEREQYWINHYDTFENGCNGSLGGAGAPTLSKKDKAKMINEYENGTPIKVLVERYCQGECNIRKIIREENHVSHTWANGLQPPPFYIYNLPWDIVIPNDNSQPLQIF